MISVESYKHLLIFIMILLLPRFVNAQSLRSLNNEGVDLYKSGKYAESEISFKKGHEKEPGHITTFNLGDAFYKQQRYDEAIKTYQSALTQNDDKKFKSKVYHNIGNSYLKSQKLDESIKSYKEALKLNPYDEETKYNLSYALSMKKNEDQKNDQDKNDQKKNDQQQDQQQNQDNKDKNDQQKNDENKGKNNDENRPDQNQTTKQDNLKQPQQNKISKEEAERILNALKNNEQDLQKKLRKQKGTPVKTEKDW